LKKNEITPTTSALLVAMGKKKCMLQEGVEPPIFALQRQCLATWPLEQEKHLLFIFVLPFVMEVAIFWYEAF
jgi:hypothetical protein